MSYYLTRRESYQRVLFHGVSELGSWNQKERQILEIIHRVGKVSS